MAERIFCCCGVAPRTKLIGWSQLICFVGVIILTGVEWAHLEALRTDPGNANISYGHDLTANETLILEYITQIAWIEFVLSVLVGFPCILMAIILLCGAYNVRQV
ncbi:unnamed protein product [Allacma fusca]|uniref:Uncharacterized protein n=1 Tax=Allacma fusca TaxID=39272 RepID=A0A8J2K5C0_9HEXA|nr:unnamed protein product [Allacma fusca]